MGHAMSVRQTLTSGSICLTCLGLLTHVESMPRTKPEPSKLDRATVLRIAADAGVDPRTVEAELAAQRGEREPVKGLAGERVRKAIAALVTSLTETR